MATYGEIYNFEYNDFLGRKTTCKIYQKNFTGVATEIAMGGDPIQIETKSDNDYLFNQIYGSECTLNITATTSLQFIGLFDSDAFKNKVVILKEPEPGEPQEVFWTGFILPDQYSEPLDYYINYPVTLTARDAIGALKDIDFVQTNGSRYVGKVPIIKAIAECLKKTQLELNINFSANLKEVNSSYVNDPLENIFIDYEAFYLSKIPNTEYVLKQLLQSFGCRLVQNWGEWYVQRVSLFRSNHSIFKYTFAGVYASTSVYSPYKTYTGKYDYTNNRLFFIDKKGQLEINPAYKSFEINQSFGKKTSILNNNSFEIFNPKTAVVDSGTASSYYNIPGWKVTTNPYYHSFDNVTRESIGEKYSDVDKYCFKSYSLPSLPNSAFQYEYLTLKSDSIKVKASPNKGIKISFEAITTSQRGKIMVRIGNQYLIIKDTAAGQEDDLDYSGKEADTELTATETRIWFGVESDEGFQNYTLNFIPVTDIDEFIYIEFSLPINSYYYNTLNRLFYIDNVNIDFINVSGQLAYPENVLYSVIVNPDNNEKPDTITSILGDMPQLSDNEDIYIGGYWWFDGVGFTPTYTWNVIGTDRDLSLMEILAESILDQHIKPKQKINGTLLGNFDFNHCVLIGFMSSKIYLPIRTTLSDKYCKFDVEMIELLEADGEGGRVLSDHLSQPIVTNEDKLLKIT
jgi:hypothetical protein